MTSGFMPSAPYGDVASSDLQLPAGAAFGSHPPVAGPTGVLLTNAGATGVNL